MWPRRVATDEKESKLFDRWGSILSYMLVAPFADVAWLYWKWPNTTFLGLHRKIRFPILWMKGMRENSIKSPHEVYSLPCLSCLILVQEKIFCKR